MILGIDLGRPGYMAQLFCMLISTSRVDVFLYFKIFSTTCQRMPFSVPLCVPMFCCPICFQSFFFIPVSSALFLLSLSFPSLVRASPSYLVDTVTHRTVLRLVAPLWHERRMDGMKIKTRHSRVSKSSSVPSRHGEYGEKLNV